MQTELLIYGIVFVGVFALIEGLYLFAFGRNITINNKVNRRLSMLSEAGSREDVLAKLRKELDMHETARNIPIYSLLATQIQKAVLPISPLQTIGIMAILSFVVFIVVSIATASGLGTKLILAGLIGIGGPVMWVGSKAKKRMQLLEEQLPEAINLMVRSLRVGHPFTSALSIASNESQDPLATELGIVADEIAYGRDVGDSLNHMAHRLDMQDLRFLAVAVTIQQQSGGNLAEILNGLTEVIRERFRLFRKVQAITSEAKSSGKLLSAFPFIAILAVNLLDPNYYDDVIEHPLFTIGCFVVFGFIFANLIVMKMILNIKV